MKICSSKQERNVQFSHVSLINLTLLNSHLYFHIMIAEPTSPRCKTPANIKSLRQVERYFEAANECIRYIKALGLDNSNFISSTFPATFKDKRPDKDSAAEQFKSVVSQADSGFSFLSPKILNLLPTKKESFNGKATFLSPNLLSFHDDGLLPLPRLLKVRRFIVRF